MERGGFIIPEKIFTSYANASLCYSSKAIFLKSVALLILSCHRELKKMAHKIAPIDRVEKWQ